MEKPKIEEISSIEYILGRIDKFSIYEKIDIHKELISFLKDLNFSKKNLENLDFITSETEGHFFIFDNNNRFHLVISEKEMTFILDTNLPKEEIIAKLERYFKILE